MPVGETQEERLEETLPNIMKRRTEADRRQNKLTGSAGEQTLDTQTH